MIRMPIQNLGCNCLTFLLVNISYSLILMTRSIRRDSSEIAKRIDSLTQNLLHKCLKLLLLHKFLNLQFNIWCFHWNSYGYEKLVHSGLLIQSPHRNIHPFALLPIFFPPPFHLFLTRTWLDEEEVRLGLVEQDQKWKILPFAHQ
jgi:hypothetical protein